MASARCALAMRSPRAPDKRRQQVAAVAPALACRITLIDPSVSRTTAPTSDGSATLPPEARPAPLRGSLVARGGPGRETFHDEAGSMSAGCLIRRLNQGVKAIRMGWGASPSRAQARNAGIQAEAASTSAIASSKAATSSPRTAFVRAATAARSRRRSSRNPAGGARLIVGICRMRRSRGGGLPHAVSCAQWSGNQGDARGQGGLQFTPNLLSTKPHEIRQFTPKSLILCDHNSLLISRSWVRIPARSPKIQDITRASALLRGQA